MGVGERGDPHEHVLERADVGDRRAAVALQQRERAQRAHELRGVRAAQRREADADVAEQLGGAAAESADDDGPEVGVGEHARDQLDAARRRAPLRRSGRRRRRAAPSTSSGCSQPSPRASAAGDHRGGRVGVDAVERRAVVGPAVAPARVAGDAAERARRLDGAAVQRHGAAARERGQLGVAVRHERAEQRRVAGRARRAAPRRRRPRGRVTGTSTATIASTPGAPCARSPRRSRAASASAPRSTGGRGVQAGGRAARPRRRSPGRARWRRCRRGRPPGSGWAASSAVDVELLEDGVRADHAGVLEQRVDRDVGGAEQRAGRASRPRARARRRGRPLLTATIGFGRGDPPGDRRRTGAGCRTTRGRAARRASPGRAPSTAGSRCRRGPPCRPSRRTRTARRRGAPPRRSPRSPIAPLWEASATGPGGRRHRRRGRVQPQARVRVEHAERARADEPHPAGAADREQLRAAARRPSSPPSRKPPESTTSARTPAAPHARACSSTSSAGTASTAELGRRAAAPRRRRASRARAARRRSRPRAGCASRSPPAAVPPTVTSTTDAGRSTWATAAAAAARPRSSKRARARLADRGRHLDLELARRRVHLDREAGLAEHADHAAVGRVHVGDERRDAVARGGAGEVGEQDRRDPAAVPVVGDLEGDLGARRRLPERTSRGRRSARASRRSRRARRRRSVSVAAAAIRSMSTPEDRKRSQREFSDIPASSSRSAVDVVGRAPRARARSSRPAARRRPAGHGRR